MSLFTVVLIEDAQGDLANMWVGAPDRGAITMAFDRIERELAQSPKPFGTLLSEGLWKLYREPLKVFYSIDEAAMVVEISRVQFIPLNGARSGNRPDN
jgi:hypothetical protein